MEDYQPLNSRIIDDFGLNPELCPLNLVIMGMFTIVGDGAAIRGQWGIFGGSHGFVKVDGQLSSPMDDYHSYVTCLIRDRHRELPFEVIEP
jgi:hypothetical protein